jgi:hypothetical protein
MYCLITTVYTMVYIIRWLIVFGTVDSAGLLSFPHHSMADRIFTDIQLLLHMDTEDHDCLLRNV